MTTFEVLAAYERYLNSVIALALADAARDAARRSDGDPRVQRLAWIPANLIDADRSGRITIVVGAASIAAVDGNPLAEESSTQLSRTA